MSKLGLRGKTDEKERISRNDERGGCFLRKCRKTGLALCCSKARNISETGNETMTDRSLLKNHATIYFRRKYIRQRYTEKKSILIPTTLLTDYELRRFIYIFSPLIV